MSLSNLIRAKSEPAKFATAIPATSATPRAESVRTVASVATVAVAKSESEKPEKVGAGDTAMEPIDREAWEERAAIAEYDGGLIRADAETLAWREDDRRRCRQCLNLKGEACSIAKPGGLVSASKGYRPASLPMRCAGYSPKAGDTDQRAGAVRWPGLAS